MSLNKCVLVAVVSVALLLVTQVSQHFCEMQEVTRPDDVLSKHVVRKLYTEFVTFLSNNTYQEVWKDFQQNDTCQTDIANYFAALQSILPSHAENNVLQNDTTSNEWAFQMFDATGKPPTGILEGNNNWMGSFSECLKISVPKDNNTNVGFKGQYCTATLQATPTNDTSFITKSTDIRVLLGLGLSFGICWPSSCSANQTQQILNHLLINVKQIELSVTINPDSCSVDKPRELDGSAIAVIIIFSAFGLVIIVGTIIDIWSTWDQTHNSKNLETTTQISVLRRIVTSFSVYKNGKKILNTKNSKETLTAIHGIRFISMTWVILGHTYSSITLVPIKNIMDVKDMIHVLAFDTVLNATFSVDTFYFLSGFLVTYVFLKEMRKSNGQFGLYKYFLYYFHRFWRLTPVYAMAIAFMAGIFPYVASGPLWTLSTTTSVNTCRNYWWRNLLYIQNLYNDDMCLGQSWYLGTDMQFYVVSLIILIPLYKKPAIGLSIMGMFFVATTVTAGLIIHFGNLIGFPLENLIALRNTDKNTRYMNDVYTKPWCRMGPYLLGMFLAYILYIKGMKIKLQPIFVLIGWGLAAALGLVLVYGNYYYFTGELIMSNGLNSIYGALSRSAWGIVLCWVLFACVTGHGGYVNMLLSWKALVPLSRLTYSAYLIHIFVIMAFFLSQEMVFYINHFLVITIYLGILVWTMGFAFLFSLAFEAPMMELEKIFLPHRSETSSETNNPQLLRHQELEDDDNHHSEINIPRVTTIHHASSTGSTIDDHVRIDGNGATMHENYGFVREEVERT